MEEKIENIKLSNKQIATEAKNNPIRYPTYPNKEDIYRQYKEEVDIDTENISKKKR